MGAMDAWNMYRNLAVSKYLHINTVLQSKAKNAWKIDTTYYLLPYLLTLLTLLTYLLT